MIIKKLRLASCKTKNVLSKCQRLNILIFLPLYLRIREFSVDALILCHSLLDAPLQMSS